MIGSQIADSQGGLFERELPYLLYFANDGAAPRQGATALYVRGDRSPFAAYDLQSVCRGRFPMELLRYSTCDNDQKCIERIVKSFRAGRWVLLDLQCDPSPRLVKLLIGFDRAQQIEVRRNGNPEQMPPASRLVVFCERACIHEQIRDRRFCEIFRMIRGI